MPFAKSSPQDRVRCGIEELKYLDECGKAMLLNPEIFRDIVTRDSVMYGIFSHIEAIAPSSWPVLITGETGTGKELIAQAVHKASGRRGAFVAVNAAGIDDNLFSDMLFGHKNGAFTGADQDRSGLIEQAAGGTLFLDEIGDLSVLAQTKLLRLIQENSFYPVGSDKAVTCDTRIVTATNLNLQLAVEQGRFRKDLFYRLETHSIRLPSLRERREDIPLLVEHFLVKAAPGLNRRSVPRVSSEVMSLLETYDFPGNVRELESLVTDLLARSKNTLSVQLLRELIGYRQDYFDDFEQRSHRVHCPLREFCFKDSFPTLKEVNEFLISKAMEKTKGNQTAAASLLGMTRRALNNRLRRASEK